MSRSSSRTVTPVKSPKKKAPKKPMSPRTAQFITIGVALAFVVAITAILVTSLGGGGGQTDALPEVEPNGDAQVQRADSLFINDPADAEVTIVEFLDFQCPACAVASGSVASIIETYGDRVAVVIRHFPLTDIHPSAVDAALAFEAAAAQGATVEMYRALFATQQEWSVGGGSKAGFFRDLADQLGLDLAAYDSAVADPATLERVAVDRADAVGLGLQGTPSFFIDGEPAALQSFDELRVLVEQKLGE